MKNPIKSIIRYLVVLAANPATLGALRYLPKYIRQLREFKTKGGRVSRYFPVLNEYRSTAGKASGQYFHQDLLVASFVCTNNPKRHIDVGSMINGFVAHVAAFRPIDVIDIRPLPDTGHRNIRFVQVDLMGNELELPTADSVSCLHAIEHFGLGRYGDPIDPDGHKKGFRNLMKMVEPGGTLYISFPIGERTEVQFNANRIFHPHDIFQWTEEKGFDLQRFDFVDAKGDLHQNADLYKDVAGMAGGCGIYTLKKH